MKLYTFLGILLFCNGFLLQAQDPVLSQYYANKMYLNPALTGFEGGTSINTNFRNQWVLVDGGMAEFTTKAFGVEADIPCLQSAFGLSYLDNIEGTGFLRWQSAGFSYAWRSKSEDAFADQNFELSLGLKGSYNWRSLNWENLVFSDQLDAIYGIIGPTQLSVPASMQSNSSYVDLDAGAVVMWSLSKGKRVRAGLAINHLVRIDPSLESLDDTLSERATFHASYVHTQSFGGKRTYEIVPMLKIDLQQSANVGLGQGFLYRSFLYGVAVGFQEMPGLWGGAWLHTRSGIPNREDINSIVLALGFEVGDFKKLAQADNTYRVGFSYDYNFTGLRSDGGGTMELSLTMNFANAHLMNCDRRRRKGPPCPRF